MPNDVKEHTERHNKNYAVHVDEKLKKFENELTEDVSAFAGHEFQNLDLKKKHEWAS